MTRFKALKQNNVDKVMINAILPVVARRLIS